MEKQFWDIISGELREAGCQPRKRGFATKPIKPGLESWISIGMRRRNKNLVVDPHFGLRCNAVHKIKSEIYHENWTKYHPYLPSTASKNLGYFTPLHEYSEYKLFHEVNFEGVAREIISNLIDHGFPSIEKLETIDDIADFIFDNVNPLYFVERICIIIHLSGQGWSQVAAFLSSVSDREIEKSREFLSRFRDYVADNPVARPLAEYA